MTASQTQSSTQPDTPLAPVDEIVESRSELSAPLAWLTGERLLYLCIIAIAASTRLAMLTHYPLNSAEASQALVGLTIFQGNIPLDAANYSPMMATLNSLTFLLFSVSDTTARFGAVLLGLVLVILPFGLRKQLGVFAALIASFILSLSASSLYWARFNTGDIGSAVGLLMLIVGFVNWPEREDSVPVWTMVGGVVILLLSAPSQFTVWVMIILLVLYLFVVDRDLGLFLQGRLAYSDLNLGQIGLVSLGLIVLIGTSALFNLTGLGAIADLFNVWLGQFGVSLQPDTVLPTLLLLLFYEPLVVIFGLVGVVLSFRESRSFDQLLVIIFGVTILLDLLMSGRQGGQILIALVPLTLLASRPIATILTGFWTEGQIEVEGLFVCFGLILVSFVYISLASWSKCMPNVSIPGCETAWILPPAGALLIVVWFIMFWQYYTLSTAWRGLGILTFVVATVLSIGASWRLNYAPLKDLSLQPMVAEAPATRFVTLLDDIGRISAERRSDPTQIDVALLGVDSPTFRWYLRDFSAVRSVAGFAEARGTSLILAPPEAGHPFEDTYTGQDYALTNRWQMTALVGKQWIRWYLFRFLPEQLPIANEDVVLWVRK
ncbi:MAG: hypothetical protein AAF629_19440 [Chloroflexota bacterium]